MKRIFKYIIFIILGIGATVGTIFILTCNDYTEAGKPLYYSIAGIGIACVFILFIYAARHYIKRFFIVSAVVIAARISQKINSCTFINECARNKKDNESFEDMYYRMSDRYDRLFSDDRI